MDAIILWAAERPGTSTAVLRCTDGGRYAYADRLTLRDPEDWRPGAGDLVRIELREETTRRIARMVHLGKGTPEPGADLPF